MAFSLQADRWGLGKNGLNMTMLALGACMGHRVCSADELGQSPSLRPLVQLGQRSYEVYLTHMFIVFAFFALFMKLGKPMRAVPSLFVAVILVSGLSEELVARLYSEPMNRLLRNYWGEGGNRLGSAVSRPAQSKNSSTPHPNSH